MTKSLSASMALTAAALFLGACSGKNTETAKPGEDAQANKEAPAANIKCFGVNECAGQAACDVPDGYLGEGSVGHECGGQNECRGKGWILLPADDCKAQGGKKM